LTAEPGRRFDPKGFVQSIFFLSGRGMEALDPRLIHVDMAARAGTCAATVRPEVNAPIANNLHDSPAIDGRKSMLATAVIDHQKENIIGASFFGRLFQG
jgi:hypothetical protein